MSKQIRSLQLEATKLHLQLERAILQLDKTEKCCHWLPVLSASALCKADTDRRLAATVLLRQTAEKKELYWLAVQIIQPRLAAVTAALAYWQQTNSALH